MDDHVSPEPWKKRLRYLWSDKKTDYGMALVRPEGIVGVLIAVYSEQMVNGNAEKFCNLAHWCVRPEYRSESLRLFRAFTARKDLTITGFSQIRKVVKIASALGFHTLDDYVFVIPNLGTPYRTKDARAISSYEEIFGIVDERHKKILADHGRTSPGRYILITDGVDWCLSVNKRQMRRRICFSVPIYVSDRFLFRRWLAKFLVAYRSLDGCWLTLCQPRFLPEPPAIAIKIREPRPHMFKSKTLTQADITCLYSELLI
jgi:hypothetical protein